MTSFIKRYEPTSLADVIFPDESTERCIKALATGGMWHNILLSGDPGTGKTTVAKLIPLTYLPPQANGDIHHTDGATCSSVDYVRTSITNFAGTSALNEKGKRFFIIDECEGLSPQAQAALRTVVERNQDHCMFIFTTNSPNDLNNALRDRFEEYTFQRPSPDLLLRRATLVLESENVNIPEERLLPILTECISYRDMLRKLERLVASFRQ